MAHVAQQMVIWQERSGVIARQQVIAQRHVSVVLGVQQENGQYGINHHGECPLCPNEALALAGASSQVRTSRPVRECWNIQQTCESGTQPASRTGLARAAVGATQRYCSVA